MVCSGWGGTYLTVQNYFEVLVLFHDLPQVHCAALRLRFGAVLTAPAKTNSSDR